MVKALPHKYYLMEIVKSANEEPQHFPSRIYDPDDEIMVLDLNSLGRLLALVLVSVVVTLIILIVMRLIREWHSRRKYR